MLIKDFEIPDYGIIKISEYGDIYGIQNYTRRRKLTPDKDGYLRLSIKYRQPHKDNNGNIIEYSKIFVHRLVALCYIDNPNDYPVVNHKDGNKQNNHYSNLEWCTSKQNHNHAILNNLDKGINGIRNPKNKLSENDVSQIRKDYDVAIEKGYKFYNMYAEKYNVSNETIRHICKRKTWNNI